MTVVTIAGNRRQRRSFFFSSPSLSFFGQEFLFQASCFCLPAQMKEVPEKNANPSIVVKTEKAEDNCGSNPAVGTEEGKSRTDDSSACSDWQSKTESTQDVDVDVPANPDDNQAEDAEDPAGNVRTHRFAVRKRLCTMVDSGGVLVFGCDDPYIIFFLSSFLRRILETRAKRSS